MHLYRCRGEEHHSLFWNRNKVELSESIRVLSREGYPSPCNNCYAVLNDVSLIAVRKERTLQLSRILKELRAERDKLDKAIAALQSVDSPKRAGRPRKKRRISAAGRRRLSEMMKKRWAERKKKAKAA